MLMLAMLSGEAPYSPLFRGFEMEKLGNILVCPLGVNVGWATLSSITLLSQQSNRELDLLILALLWTIISV